MSYLTYDNPEYNIVLSIGVKSNEANSSSEIYYNIDSHIKYSVTPSYIYDYSDITYKLMKQVDDTYVEVDNSLYSIDLLNLNDEEIDDMSSYTGAYYVVVNTSDELESGYYKLVIDYTNPNNNISLKNETSSMIDLTNKYYEDLEEQRMEEEVCRR